MLASTDNEDNGEYKSRTFNSKNTVTLRSSICGIIQNAIILFKRCNLFAQGLYCLGRLHYNWGTNFVSLVALDRLKWLHNT